MFCQYHYDLVSHDSYGKPNNPDAYARLLQILVPRKPLMEVSVIYVEKTGEPQYSNQLLLFTCQAEDAQHAREQCLDAYPGCVILSLSKLNPKDHLEEFTLISDSLPPWAITRNYAQELFPGAQLHTKDGRKIGNGWVIAESSEEGTWNIITDAGNVVESLSTEEILSLFHIGEFVSEPKSILERFSRS